MAVNQISVFLENKPGKLAAFTQLLRDNNIDIRALFIAESENYGILRLIVTDVYDTLTILKSAGYVFKITPVVAVAFDDQPGSLSEMISVLGEHDINIEYMYAFTSRRKDRAYAVLRVEDNDKAVEVLTANRYFPVDQNDLAIDD